MPTSPSPITAAPPAPSTTDPANFDALGDVLLSWIATNMVPEHNAAATVTYNNALEAAASATDATAARDAAIAASGAEMWSAGASYADGEAAISPTNYRAYRRKTPGGIDATDPASSALWEPMSITRLGASGLEYWDGV